MVPENIHTSPTEGIGNSRGVGGSRVQEIPEEGGGGVSIIYLFFPDRPVCMFNFRLFAFCSRAADAKINLAQHKTNIFFVVRLDFCRHSSPVIFPNSGW